jgi:hypothetical protein
VAYSGTGNLVMTSPDGITWTSQTSAANNQWRSVTYVNGLFVAVADTGTGNRVMTSPDGITWTIRTSAADNSWNSVTYGNGVFVAVAYSGTGNRVMTMSPPVNWGGAVSDNYGTVTSNGSDPTQGGSTIRAQSYITNNYFTNPANIATGEYGRWDFNLNMAYATYESTYCFRITKSDGTLLNSYSTWPEVTRCTVPPTNRRMRNNSAFCAGTRRGFFWNR